MGICFEHSENIIQLYNELRKCIYILIGYNRIQYRDIMAIKREYVYIYM
jgi:hypothetical protein